MKKLLRTEMKKVMGGGNTTGGCPTACAKWNNSTQKTESGFCNKTSTTVNGVTLEGCECSLAGGNGCN